MEDLTRTLEPVRRVGQPGQAATGADVEEHRELREQPADSPEGEPFDVVRLELASAGLVGDRGVEVAIGEHDGAARQRGADHLGDVLGAVRRVDQRLGTRIDVVAVEHERAQHLPEGRPAGFPGPDDLP